MTRSSSRIWVPGQSLLPADGGPNGGQQILQASLAEYKELQACERRRQQLRNNLIYYLLHDAQIEPGALNAELQERSLRLFSFDKLVALGGMEWATEVRARIEPTVSQSVIIWRNDEWTRRTYTGYPHAGHRGCGIDDDEPGEEVRG